MSWSNFCLKEKNWSSLPQETSSTPWHQPVLTSCWGGKGATLLWAHSQSTQRRAPLFLESRPRGGDWSGHYFDMRVSSADFVHSDEFFSSQTVNVAFYTCLPPTLLQNLFYQNTKTRTKSSSVTPEQVSSNISYLQLPCCTHQSRLLLKNGVSFPLSWRVCITTLHPEEEQWKPLTGAGSRVPVR